MLLLMKGNNVRPIRSANHSEQPAAVSVVPDNAPVEVGGMCKSSRLPCYDMLPWKGTVKRTPTRNSPASDGRVIRALSGRRACVAELC
jgi:hypothetical protein